MRFIQKDNGDIIYDSNSITKEVKTFDENLYASRENEVVNGTIENINIPTMSQEESDNLEGSISIQEALSALKQMKNDKSPESDGYTNEFFQFFFFTDLGTFMTESINYGFYSKENEFTDRVLDLCNRTAKYNIFISKLHGTIPHVNVFCNLCEE